MAAIIYALCALASLACAALLWRAQRESGSRLLFWSALCFVLLAVNNGLLVVDKLVFPTEVDLRYWRAAFALTGAALLVYGLVMEES